MNKNEVYKNAIENYAKDHIWIGFPDIKEIPADKKLPDAPVKVWNSNTPANLGGWLELAGIDPANVFTGKTIKDHPWLGLEIEFPTFRDAVGSGRVIRCLIHPLGGLLFDVEFNDPTPNILYSGGEWKLGFEDKYMVRTHRFNANDLLELTQVKETAK